MDISISNGRLAYYPDFLSKEKADNLLERLREQVSYRQNTIKMFGKIYDEPRLTAWYADTGLSYTYSGIQMKTLAWSDLLYQLKGDVEQRTSATFNSALLNYYRDGQDSMGWHQDNEKELGLNPTIASLSLGATRKFQLKHIGDTLIPRQEIALTHGSLLIMSGEIQHYWKHQIPKTQKVITDRINITFRKIISLDSNT